MVPNTVKVKLKEELLAISKSTDESDTKLAKVIALLLRHEQVGLLKHNNSDQALQSISDQIYSITEQFNNDDMKLPNLVLKLLSSDEIQRQSFNVALHSGHFQVDYQLQLSGGVLRQLLSTCDFNTSDIDITVALTLKRDNGVEFDVAKLPQEDLITLRDNTNMKCMQLLRQVFVGLGESKWYNFHSVSMVSYLKCKDVTIDLIHEYGMSNVREVFQVNTLKLPLLSENESKLVCRSDVDIECLLNDLSKKQLVMFDSIDNLYKLSTSYKFEKLVRLNKLGFQLILTNGTQDTLFCHLLNTILALDVAMEVKSSMFRLVASFTEESHNPKEPKGLNSYRHCIELLKSPIRSTRTKHQKNRINGQRNQNWFTGDNPQHSKVSVKFKTVRFHLSKGSFEEYACLTEEEINEMKLLRCLQQQMYAFSDFVLLIFAVDLMRSTEIMSTMEAKVKTLDIDKLVCKTPQEMVQNSQHRLLKLFAGNGKKVTLTSQFEKYITTLRKVSPCFANVYGYFSGATVAAIKHQVSVLLGNHMMRTRHRIFTYMISILNSVLPASTKVKHKYVHNLVNFVVGHDTQENLQNVFFQLVHHAMKDDSKLEEEFEEIDEEQSSSNSKTYRAEVGKLLQDGLSKEFIMKELDTRWGDLLKVLLDLQEIYERTSQFIKKDRTPLPFEPFKASLKKAEQLENEVQDEEDDQVKLNQEQLLSLLFDMTLLVSMNKYDERYKSTREKRLKELIKPNETGHTCEEYSKRFWNRINCQFQNDLTEKEKEEKENGSQSKKNKQYKRLVKLLKKRLFPIKRTSSLDKVFPLLSKDKPSEFRVTCSMLDQPFSGQGKVRNLQGFHEPWLENDDLRANRLLNSIAKLAKQEGSLLFDTGNTSLLMYKTLCCNMVSYSITCLQVTEKQQDEAASSSEKKDVNRKRKRQTLIGNASKRPNVEQLGTTDDDDGADVVKVKSYVQSFLDEQKQHQDELSQYKMFIVCDPNRREDYFKAFTNNEQLPTYCFKYSKRELNEVSSGNVCNRLSKQLLKVDICQIGDEQITLQKLAKVKENRLNVAKLHALLIAVWNKTSRQLIIDTLYTGGKGQKLYDEMVKELQDSIVSTEKATNATNPRSLKSRKRRLIHFTEKVDGDDSLKYFQHVANLENLASIQAMKKNRLRGNMTEVIKRKLLSNENVVLNHFVPLGSNDVKLKWLQDNCILIYDKSTNFNGSSSKKLLKSFKTLGIEVKHQSEFRTSKGYCDETVEDLRASLSTDNDTKRSSYCQHFGKCDNKECSFKRALHRVVAAKSPQGKTVVANRDVKSNNTMQKVVLSRIRSQYVPGVMSDSSGKLLIHALDLINNSSGQNSTTLMGNKPNGNLHQGADIAQGQGVSQSDQNSAPVVVRDESSILRKLLTYAMELKEMESLTEATFKWVAVTWLCATVLKPYDSKRTVVATAEAVATFTSGCLFD